MLRKEFWFLQIEWEIMNYNWQEHQKFISLRACLYFNSSVTHRLRAKSFLLCNVGSCPAGLLFEVVLQTFGKDARHLAQECKSRNLLSECAKRNFKLS